MTISESGSSDTHPNWRRNQAAITLATFIGFAGFTLVMPFLPLYFGELGVTDTSAIAIWSGFSLGVTPAITAALAPAWARVSDRLGRKFMVVRSLISFVVIMTLLGFVRHPWQVVALRAVQGVFAGYGPIALTMAAESSPREQMARAIGWVQTAQRLGPALGPVIGGTLAQTIGLRETFIAAACFYFAALVLVAFGYREGQERAAAADTPQLITFQSLRVVPHFVLFVGVVCGLQLVDRSFGPVLPLYLQDTGMSVANVPFWSGIILTLTGAAAAIGHHFAGWLLDRLEPARLVPLAMIIAAGGAGIFGVAPPLAMMLLAALIFGVAIGTATTVVYTAAGRAVSRSQRNVAFGYLSRAYLVGLAVSPVVAGFIGSLKMRAVFLVDAGGLGFVAWLVRDQMSRRPVLDTVVRD